MRTATFHRLWIPVALVVLAIALVLFGRGSNPAPDELLRDARTALRVGDYERAESLAACVPAASSRFAEARLIAGEAATRRGSYKRALEYYSEILDGEGQDSATALYCSGDLLLQLGRPSEAERYYRRALSRRPEDVATREQLARLLGAFGRRWESMPHLLDVVRVNPASVEFLLLLGNPDAVLDVPPGIENYRRQAPEDPLPLICLARTALHHRQFDQAEQLARQALEFDSGQIEAWVILGSALLQGPASEFQKWEAQLPDAALEHPDWWIVRGTWARQQGDSRVAVRCFWEAVRRAPESRSANYNLGQVLAAVGESEHSARFLERARRLQELEGLFNVIYRDRATSVLNRERTLAHFQRAAEITEELGRFWEARGWCAAALAINPGSRRAHERIRRVEARLATDSPRTLPGFNPASHADLSGFPLPSQPLTPAGDAAPALAGAAAAPSFADSARSAGIEFRYFNGSAAPKDGKLIFQTLGGGVAVLDFDRDAWPDLFLGQGSVWPPGAASRADRDCLYRNLGSGRFQEVARPAEIGDEDYSHGAAVGDLDSDGFCDLYLANEGMNRLYRNNGDGTFADISSEAGLESRRGTTSCLIADLNGDSLPDLYDVNYVTADDAYSLVCQRDGKPRTCDPALFQAERDEVFLNAGNWRFEDATASAGVGVPGGKGLGIVAADFTGSGRLDLFVANDTEANFFFSNEAESGHSLFREAALECGVAFDESGRAQACMGIAVEDVDGNGLLDLFVTNFYEEPNTLYSQTAPHLFEDLTGRAGLVKPSYLQLGFGTQFLDADLDGLPDLVVANGHIEDFTADGQPHEMPPQFFRNLGEGRFEEVPAQTLGPYFAGKYLGRSLARLDWNRDLRDDFVVSHLDAPVALLTNQTSGAGHSVAFRFAGVESARDAIGTTVEVTAGGRTAMRQLTAGDGYLASNQRQLIFGLGAAERIERLLIRWPSGLEQAFSEIPAGQELLLIEGRATPISVAGRSANPTSAE